MIHAVELHEVLTFIASVLQRIGNCNVRNSDQIQIQRAKQMAHSYMGTVHFNPIQNSIFRSFVPMRVVISSGNPTLWDGAIPTQYVLSCIDWQSFN